MRENNKHMVLDADGLYIVTKNLDLIKGYKNAILTPNKAEFGRLAKQLDVDLEDKDRFVAVTLLLCHMIKPTFSDSSQCSPDATCMCFVCVQFKSCQPCTSQTMHLPVSHMIPFSLPKLKIHPSVV